MPYNPLLINYLDELKTNSFLSFPFLTEEEIIEAQQLTRHMTFRKTEPEETCLPERDYIYSSGQT